MAVGDDDWAGRCGELYELSMGWQPAVMVDLAEQIAIRSTDPYESAQANLFALAGMINLGQVATPECENLIERTNDAVDRFPMPALLAEYHTLRGAVSSLYAPEQALMRAVAARRVLNDNDATDKATWIAWHDLSVLESALSLSDNALDAQLRTEELAGRWGFATNSVLPRLDVALVKDHHGDTEGCARDLEELIRWPRDTGGEGDRPEVRPMDSHYIGYAVARLAVFGADIDIEPESFFHDRRSDPWSDCFRALARACMEIVRKRPHQALEILDKVVPLDQITVSDVLRLRSLALTEQGAHAEAWQIEREMFRVATESSRRMQRLAFEGVGAARERAALVELLRDRTNEAFTDMLTRMPNRRHFEIMWSELVRSGSVVVGMLDLDNFKAVNTIHGHRVGDRVLSRAAELLRESFRGGDFVARFGGDEFVAVLADTEMDDAVRLGHQIKARLAGQDWSDVAPGTPVGVTIGWSLSAEKTDIKEALRIADAAMYAAKADR